MPPIEPEPTADEPERASRADRKRANRLSEEALARLSSELVRLSDKKLEALELEDEVLEAVKEAQAMRTAIAKNRQLGQVRALLRDTDWSIVQHRVTTLLHTGVVTVRASDTSARAAERETASWVTRLLADGTSAVDDFVRHYPSADRARLAELVRAVGRAPHGRRAKAEKRLADAVRGSLPR